MVRVARNDGSCFDHSVSVSPIGGEAMLKANLMRGLIPLALAVGFGILASPQAKANPAVTLQIDVYSDAARTVNIFSTTDVIVTDAFGEYSDNKIGGGVSLRLSGSSNAPGDPSIGQLLSNHVDGTLTGTPARYITVTATTDPFTLPGSPGSPVLVTSIISSTKNPTRLVFNTTFDGIDMADQTPPNTITGSLVTQVFTRGATYTLSNTTQVNLTQTGAAGQVQSNGTSQVTALPEPGTLALVGFGLPLLGLGAWRRRRNASKA